MIAPHSHHTIANSRRRVPAAAAALLAACLVFAGLCGSKMVGPAEGRAAIDAGAAYFVDRSHPDCNDTPSNGSESKPWRTITYALSRLKGGDTLLVKSGTYSETFDIVDLAGTPEKNTTVKVYPGHTVTLQGRDIRSGRIRIRRSRHLVFDGFAITNMNHGIFVEGGSQYVTLQNCTVHHVGQEGIHVKQDSDHVTIQNCTIHDTGQWTVRNGEGIYIGTGSRGSKDNTGFTVVRNNTIYNTTDEAIELKPGTHDALVEGNTIYGVAFRQFTATVGAIEVNQAVIRGAQEWPSDPNHVVRNNLLYDTSTAIRAGTGCSVYNNVIYGLKSKSHGIYVDNLVKDTYPRRIYHNTVNLPSADAVVVAGLQAKQVDIRNNIGPAAAGNIAASAAYFVDPAKGDFHLHGGAAPVDAGVDLSAMLSAAAGVKTDKDGVLRPQGSGWDIGAYEHQKR